MVEIVYNRLTMITYSSPPAFGFASTGVLALLLGSLLLRVASSVAWSFDDMDVGLKGAGARNPLFKAI